MQPGESRARRFPVRSKCRGRTLTYFLQEFVMNTNNPVFRKEWLKKYDIITEEMSKVELEVTSSVSSKNLIPEKEENGKTIPAHYIVNLKAIAADKVPALKALLEKYHDKDEFPIEETKGLFLTATLFANGKNLELPIKNEKVVCSIGTVEDREKNEVLRVTSMSVRPAQKATKLAAGFEDLFASVTTGKEIETAKK